MLQPRVAHGAMSLFARNDRKERTNVFESWWLICSCGSKEERKKSNCTLVMVCTKAPGAGEWRAQQATQAEETVCMCCSQSNMRCGSYGAFQSQPAAHLGDIFYNHRLSLRLTWGADENGAPERDFHLSFSCFSISISAGARFHCCDDREKRKLLDMQIVPVQSISTTQYTAKLQIFACN